MKTKLITLLIAITALLGSANAQKYDRKIQFHKNGELINTYDITDVDSITFLKIYYLEASYSVSPVGTGSVTIDGSNETPQYVLPGTNVTYNAIANSGYKFKSWNMGGTELSTSPTFTLPISSNTMLTAEFQVLPTYSVMVVSSGGGTVSSSATSVLEGNNVTLTATPNNGYKFKNWTLDGNIVSTNNPYTATVLSNSIYIANFEKIYTVSVSSTTGGTATTSSNSVVYGGNVTLTATPAEGYYFVNWTVNGEVVSTENSYTATITEDIEFVANFKEIPIIVGKKYFIKDVASGKYLNVANNTVHLYGPTGGVNAIDKTHSDDQIFIFEQSGTNYYLKTKSGKYIYCQEWNVDALDTKSPLTISYINDEQFNIKNGSSYFKVQKVDGTYYAFCNAEQRQAATFILEYVYDEPHEYVDLGLPSGLKWATCNIGASTPEEPGDLFAWGETTTKSPFFTKDNYKYYNASEESFTKYNDSDNKITLELEDDAAHVNWGGNWRMPTEEEQKELINTNNCTWEWTTQNSVNGYKVTSKKNGNYIFLPVVSIGWEGDSGNPTVYGDYWSSSLSTEDSYGQGLSFCYYYSYDYYLYTIYRNRYYGLSVRPVCE